MNNLITYLILLLGLTGCRQDNINVIIDNYKNCNLTQFNNFEIVPRDGDDESQYFMSYYTPLKDTGKGVKVGFPLFDVVFFEKTYFDSMKISFFIEPLEKSFFCNKVGIDTSNFEPYIINLFQDFEKLKCKSINFRNGVYNIKTNKYSIIYSSKDNISHNKKLLGNGYLSYDDDWYYKIQP